MKNNKSYRFLFIEDQVSDVELLVYRLKQAEFKFTYDRLVDKIAVTKYLQTKKVDLVFTDYNLPSCTGEEILKAVKNFSLNIPVILITGVLKEDKAIELIKQGFEDYLIKDNLSRLPIIITKIFLRRELEEKAKQKTVQAKEAISDYEQLFQNTTIALAYHKILYDENHQPTDYVYLQANKAFEKFTGLENQKIIGKKVTELIPNIKQDKANWVKLFGKVAISGKSQEFGTIYSEALKKWYNVSAYCPKIGFFVAVFTDVTEIKKVSEEIKEEKDRYLKLFNNSSDSIFIYNEKFYLDDANERACKFLGYLKEEMLGKRFDMFAAKNQIGGITVEERSKNILNQLKKKKVVNFEWIYKTKDDKEVYSDINVSTLIIEGSLKYLILGRDITKQRQNALLLQKQNVTLSAISQFNDIISDLSSERHIHRALHFLEAKLAVDMVSLLLVKKDEKGFHLYSEFYSQKSKQHFIPFKNWKVDKTSTDTIQNIASKVSNILLEKLKQQNYNNSFSEFLYKTNDYLSLVVFSSKDKEKLFKVDKNLLYLLLPRLSISLNNTILYEFSQQSQNTLTNFMDSAVDAFIICDMNLQLLRINEKAKELLDINEKILSSKDLFEVIPNLKKIDFHHQLKNLYEKQKSFTIERLNQANHLQRVFKMKFFYMDEKIGVIITDITSQVMVEDELATSEKKLRSLLETVPLGVAEISISGLILTVNKSLENFTKMKRIELIGENINRLIKLPSTKMNFINYLKKNSEGDIEPSPFTAFLDIPGKNTLSVQVDWSYKYNQTGSKIGYVCTFSDISQRIKSEVERDNKVKELERMNELMVGRELKMIELKQKLKGMS